MPFRPTDAMHWYYRVFKAEVEVIDLHQNKPKDWTRLQVWDGNSLKPVMPEGFSGVPNEEQINMLYSHVQNNRLFFFKLGESEPQLLTADGPVPIPKEPKEPIAPPPLQIENPTAQQVKDYNESVNKHQKLLQQYHTAQEMHQTHPTFQTAVDGYNASRNPEQDKLEWQSRNKSSSLQQMKNSRDKAERVITEMMAPRPSAPPDVFYISEKDSSYATIDYRDFDKFLEPNGYDLPQNSKLNDYDAATINFAMMGVTSETEKLFLAKGDMGPMFAKSSARDGFHFMVTGLFGYTRIKQPMSQMLGDVMKLGQTAIEAYNAGDPTLLGQRLGESVRNIKQFFTGTGQTEVTESLTAASKLTERLLDLFEKKPDIWEATGLTEQDRDFMRGYVQVGKIYDNYADSQIKFNDAFFKGTQLSQEEKAGILADAVIRKLVANELKKDSGAVESSPEYEAGLMDAMAKDQIADQKLGAWTAENRGKFENYSEYIAAESRQRKLFDCNANVTMFSSLPCEHPIITKLAQPGMLERLRQNLMKDPAILEQAGKSPMEFKPDDLDHGKKLDALVEQAQPLVELSEKQAWFDNAKSMLTQNDPNAWLDPAVAADSNRLMIVQGKKMVSVADLLDGGLQALQNPDKNTIDLLYENAKNGNLYFYSKDKDMPTRLDTDGMKPSTQQLEAVELPTRWQRFWNAVTFGWAYAKECNIPDKDPAALEMFINARAEHAAPVRNEAEAPKQESVINDQKQPQQEKTQPEQIKPWKYQAKDTRNMSNEEFFAHVKVTSEQGNDLTVVSVLNSEKCTPEAYYNIMTQKLESQVAGSIYRKAVLARTDEEKNQILEAQKKIYTSMVVGMGDYVVNHTSKKDLAEHCKHPKEFSPEYRALLQSSDEISRTGVNGYIKQVNRENAANEQAKQQSQSQQQIQAQQQIQMQQPQAAPAPLQPPVMGGPPM